jgi:hypothetical protein
MTKHFLLPDVQVKPDVPLDHLTWAGKYVAEKKPDVIVCIGDFADMESLSSYDVGKKSFEGRSYKADIDVAHHAMSLFMDPIRELQAQQRRNKEKIYRPRFILTLGNHEQRIPRAIENDRKLDGLISIFDLPYADWEVYPFLEPVVVDGICYSHYFTSGQLGRPCVSARQVLTKKHMSCVMGHQQGRDIAYAQRADGKYMTALISGSFYQHEENYLNPQTNTVWHGCWMFNDVQDGSFDEMPISLSYLKSKYG